MTNVVWAALLAAAPAGAAEADAAFGATKVWAVHLTIPAEEFKAMQPLSANPGFLGFGASRPKPPPTADGKPREMRRNMFGVDLPWATGSVTIGDQTFALIGLRYKGNGTIGDASRSIKKSFKLDLDRHGGTEQFFGMKTVNLHSGVADPSKCRETMGYAVYRSAGVPAARTALAEVRLSVPGKYDRELLGVYTVVEDAGKPFLRKNFGTDKGLLMKPEGLRDFEDKGDDWNRYKGQFRPKREATAEESKRLIAFAKLVHKADDAAFRKEIGSYLDLDNYLRFLAATAFVANTDSFFVLGHNYDLYLHPKTGRLHFIPWDLDRAFSNFPILGSNRQQMDLSFSHPYRGPHRLTDRVLAMPGMAERYRKLLKELATTAFDKGRLLKELDAVERATKDLIARDVKAGAARKDGAPPWFFGVPPALRTFIEKRTESVAAQVAGKSKGYVPDPGGTFKVGDILAGTVIEMFDADKDGKMAKDEWIAAAKKLFAACALDDRKRASQKALADALDGMAPGPADGRGGFKPGSFLAGGIVRRADADRDGKVTLEELVDAAGKLFDEFDKGKAGKLDEEAFGEMLTALFPLPNFGPPPPPKKEGKSP
jgi:spore coat protein H